MSAKPVVWLDRLGLDGATAGRLCDAVEASDGDVLLPDAPGDAAALIGAGVVAARDRSLVETALPAIVADLASRESSLDPFPRGVYWHLAGIAAWHATNDVARATTCFNRSLADLESAGGPARAYHPRVLDTLGQMLQHQGLLDDARLEYERALEGKEAVGDVEGQAITLGNLGRLCLELGDFAAARDHLVKDLAHVERSNPANARLQALLGTQIATALLETGELDEAERRLAASRTLAEEADDPVGVAFASLTQARLALLRGEIEIAGREVHRVLGLLGDRPAARLPEVEGLVLELEAEVERRRGAPGAARSLFERAFAKYTKATRISPVEWAELLRSWALACEEDGATKEAADLLRRALRALDRTSADELRQRLDRRLCALDESAWWLHGAGRFVGHREIESLIEASGGQGFRGHAEDVVVLFSDLRGFTSISERLPPATLVEVLNAYLAHMVRCVEHYGGSVDKFVGDAVMAVFSGSWAGGADADAAVHAALYMQAELERFNRTLSPDLPRLAAGVGVHAGPVVKGLVGSPQKRSVTVLGDTVNTASRLEGMTKPLGSRCLVSGEVVRRLERPGELVLAPLGPFRPAGRRRALDVHHLLGRRDGSVEAQRLETEAGGARAALALRVSGAGPQAREAYLSLAATCLDPVRGQGYEWIAARVDRVGSATERGGAIPALGAGTIEMTEK